MFFGTAKTGASPKMNHTLSRVHFLGANVTTNVLPSICSRVDLGDRIRWKISVAGECVCLAANVRAFVTSWTHHRLRGLQESDSETRGEGLFRIAVVPKLAQRAFAWGFSGAMWFLSLRLSVARSAVLSSRAHVVLNGAVWFQRLRLWSVMWG